MSFEKKNYQEVEAKDGKPETGLGPRPIARCLVSIPLDIDEIVAEFEKRLK